MADSFLTIDDYSVVTCPADLEILTQSSEDIRIRAERTAMEEVAGYVRSRYDIAAAYAARDISRNFLLVQLTVNIAIYYLGMWLPQFMGNDMRETLYQNAVSRLRDIQRGALTPDLPQYPDDNGSGSTVGDSIHYGSMPKQTYDY